jgi:hypothetical protein
MARRKAVGVEALMASRREGRRGGSLRTDALWCLALTIAIELLTCVLRFGLGMHAGNTSHWMRALTFGLHLHHGFFGLLLIVLAFARRGRLWRRWCLIIGLALVLSDLAHHFLVLWPVTGSPEFTLFYPD